MKIEKTKPTVIVSFFRTDLARVGLVFSISNFFINEICKGRNRSVEKIPTCTNLALAPHKYSIVRNKRRPYVYQFWNFFHGPWKFLSLMGVFFTITLHLFCVPYVYSFLTNFRGPTFIPYPTSIPDSRVLETVACLLR